MKMKNMMQNEILEQPLVFEQIVNRYIKDGKVKLDFPIEFDEIKFIASGSSYNCGMLGQKFFENIGHIRTSCEYSSEYMENANRKISKDVLYFFISQSGQTYDTKCAIDIVKKHGGTTFALVNNSDSDIYNTCDYKMDMGAGKEESIAATKSFSAGIVCLWLMALKVAQKKGINISKYLKNSSQVKENIEYVIKNTKNMDAAANYLCELRSFPTIGYGYCYVIAKEGALKIKETSYIDVNAYPTGEFLHGHTAILNKNSVILEIFNSNICSFEKKTLDKIQKDYNPKTIIITDMENKKGTLETIVFKNFDDELTKMLSTVVILQMLALKIAQKLGRNVDKPQGLNKIVTE